eukprot:6465769-Amphidinium_carterae.1
MGSSDGVIDLDNDEIMDLTGVGRRFPKSRPVSRPSSPEGSASGTQAPLMPGTVPCLGLTEGG